MQVTDTKLEDTISKLSSNDNVDSVLLCGSTALQTHTTSSDYDLVIVVKNKPEKLVSMFAFIGSVPSDIFFYTTKEIESILKNMSVREGAETWLLHWLESGKIFFDRSGFLTNLQRVRGDIQTGGSIPLAKSYEYKINYNLIANTRYFESGDELYNAALDIRLLYSVIEAFAGYFAMRHIYWEGEKNAILYLRKQDPEYLNIFESFCKSTSLSDKFAFYKRLAEGAFFGEYQKWDMNVAVSVDGDFSGFWNNLVGE